MSAINRKKTYMASKHILYERDEQLFYCKVGETTNDSYGELYCTVWGKSQDECKLRTAELVAWLNGDIIV